MKVVFDFDGTLHQTHIIYEKAMDTSLKEIGLSLNDIDFKSLIGKSPYDIWRSLGAKEEQISYLVHKTGSMMDEGMKEYGKLYEGVYESLEYLKKKYELIICSNCRRAYMEAARSAYGLDKYFSSYIIGEDYDFLDKASILRSLDLKSFIMVGDRENDIEAGYKNKMPSIFASYGYGDKSEGDKANFVINDISEIKSII